MHTACCVLTSDPGDPMDCGSVPLPFGFQAGIPGGCRVLLQIDPSTGLDACPHHPLISSYFYSISCLSLPSLLSPSSVSNRKCNAYIYCWGFRGASSDGKESALQFRRPGFGPWPTRTTFHALLYKNMFIHFVALSILACADLDLLCKLG